MQHRRQSRGPNVGRSEHRDSRVKRKRNQGPAEMVRQWRASIKVYAGSDSRAFKTKPHGPPPSGQEIAPETRPAPGAFPPRTSAQCLIPSAFYFCCE